jgi:hypothetical protein
MTRADFISRWSRATLGERAAAQQHFLDKSVVKPLAEVSPLPAH